MVELGCRWFRAVPAPDDHRDCTDLALRDPADLVFVEPLRDPRRFTEIAVVGPVDSPVAKAALEPFRPDTVVAVGPSEEVPLLAGKGLVDGHAAVYICELFACQAPITSNEAFTGP